MLSIFRLPQPRPQQPREKNERETEREWEQIDGNLCGFFEVRFQVHSQLQMHLQYYKEFIIIRYCGKTPWNVIELVRGSK